MRTRIERICLLALCTGVVAGCGGAGSSRDAGRDTPTGEDKASGSGGGSGSGGAAGNAGQGGGAAGTEGIGGRDGAGSGGSAGVTGTGGAGAGGGGRGGATATGGGTGTGGGAAGGGGRGGASATGGMSGQGGGGAGGVGVLCGGTRCTNSTWICLTCCGGPTCSPPGTVCTGAICPTDAGTNPSDGGVGSVCNGGQPCATGLICIVNAPGLCGANAVSGTCIRRPEACTTLYAPVCGCDAHTYGNDCERQGAGAQLDHTGAC